MSLVNAILGAFGAGAVVCLGLGWIIDRIEDTFGRG